MADQIAIVGVGCRFPGATNLKDFWDVLVKGENHVGEIPPERWNMDAFFDSNPDAIGKSYARKAGLIQNFDHFDNKLFRINESEASQMDPQQRQVLECTYMALENAGITRQQIAGQRVGVYLGAMNSDYGDMISTMSDDVSNYTVTGQAGSIVANRVSYVFDLRGPSMVIDTACSSSIVAMHQAILGIKTGDCSMAISGAVNILMNPNAFVKLSKARMMSPTGQCHAFSASADGYTRGEGCGIVLLKTLKQAEQDGDPIWATIVTGLNQDGRRATPITAPSDKQQESLLQEIYTRYNIDPTNIDYIEAHGTGTKLGDPIEVGALGSMFERYPRQRYIGSVKTNIGHLEAAAGMAGLIKVLLMMKHNTIVPSLHFDKPNELIDFDRFQFVVPTLTLPWKTKHKVACINSFGFGGSNSHVVVTAYLEDEIKSNDHRTLPICFSGSTEESLFKSIESFGNQADQVDLQRAAYTSCVKREHFRYRKALLSSSHSELGILIQKTLSFENPQSSTESKKPAKIIFVFCGMGTAWQGMCVEFIHFFSSFKLEMKKIDKSLSRFVEWSLIDRFEKGYDVEDPIFGPIAIFACQVAMARMLSILDIKPAAVLGQSVGEVAAAHIAGILPLGEAVKVIFYRTKILAKVTGGKMLLTRNTDADAAQSLCDRYDVDVALVYSPLSCTFSGDADSILQVKHELEIQSNVTARELPVTSAFHSKHMLSCQKDLNNALADLSTQAMSTQMISTVDCGLKVEQLREPSYWGRNVRETVQLYDAVKKASDARSQNIYIEIGPSPVLAAHIDDILPGNAVSKMTLPTMKRNKGSGEIIKCIANVHECGIDVSWGHIFPQALIPTDYPVHAFCHKPLLVVSHDKRDFLNGVFARTGHLFLRHGVSDTQKKIIIDPFSFQSVFEHNVRGTIILPGAVYAEAALAFAATTGNEEAGNVTLDVYFHQTVTLTPSKMTILEIKEHVTVTETKSVRKLIVTNNNVVCAKVTLKSTTLDHFEDRIDLQSIRQRCRKSMNGDEVYRLLSSGGFTYGEAMSIITNSQCGDSESLTTLTLGEKLKKETDDIFLHPVIIDGMLQSPATIAKEDKGVLPHRLENLTLRRKTRDVMLVYTKLINQSDKEDSYSLTLVTLEGLVICVIEKFALRVIGKGDFDPSTVSFSIEAQLLVNMFPKRLEQIGNNVVVFTEREIAHLPWKEFTLSRVSNFSEEELVLQIQNATIASVVLCTKPTEPTKGESLQKELQGKIMFLISLLLTMSKHSLNVPLVVVTVTPTLNNTCENEARFCIHESICAFLRCARREFPQLVVQSFDIGFSSNDEDATLVEELKNIYKFDLISQPKTTEVKLLNGELMEPRYKRLEKVTPNHRMIASHENKSIGLYVHGENVTDEVYFTVTVPKIERNIKSHDVSISVQSAVVHSKSLSDQIIRQGVLSHFSNENPILSFEFLGFSKKKMVVAFYPSEVKSSITAPKECVMKYKYIKNLNPGDVLKLYVLWCLCITADLKNVGILYSPKTRAYAEIMAIMLRSNKSSVSLLTPDDTKEIPTIQIVISTIQLTKGISKMFDENLTSVKTFICMESITKTSNIQTLLMKKVKLGLIRALDILTPVYIADHVPKLFKWIRSNQNKIQEIKHYLNTYQVADTLVPHFPLDISELLGTRKLNISHDDHQGSGIVRTSPNNLFLKTASYLVVGGQTGLGWECVSYLASRGAGRVIILSRRMPSEETKKNMKSLGQMHKCVVSFLQADVTVSHTIKTALVNLRRFNPSFPLRGVFFSAAVLKDGLISQMTGNWFEEASAPKVIGAWNLHILTKDDPLDYFVMFSSVTSAMGNAGQANYGAGNGFLDGLAHIRRQKGLAGQTINWGPLGLGMLENRSDLRKKMKSQGYLVIEKMNIEECLHHAIMLNETQIILCQLDPAALGQSLLNENNQEMLSKFDSVLTPYLTKMTVRNTKSDGIDMDGLQGKPKEQIMDQLTEYVKRLVCDIAVLDNIDMYTGTRDQGVDSMNFMQISGALLRDTNVQISAATLTVQNPSVIQLAEMLYKDRFDNKLTNQNVVSKKEPITHDQTPSSELELIPGEIFTFENYLRNPDHISLLMISKINLPDMASPEMMAVILKESVARHPISHSTFHFENGKMYKRIRDPNKTFDFHTSSEKDLEKMIHQRFFLDRSGPIRFIYVLSKPPKLILTFHRIAYDYQGVLIIINELLALSYAYSLGKSMDTVERMPDISINTEYKAILQSQYEAARSFWIKSLSSVPYVSFADKSLPQKSMDSFRVERELTREEFEKLSEFSERHSLSFFHCLVGLFELLLSFRANEPDITLTTYVDLRIFAPKIATSIGRCVNFAPLVCKVPDDSTSLLSFLTQNSYKLEECKGKGIFPFHDLQKLLSPDNAAHMLTNFVIFGDDEVRNKRKGNAFHGDFNPEVTDSLLFGPNTELYFDIISKKKSGKILISLNGREDCFSRRRIDELISAYFGLLTDALASPLMPLGNLGQQEYLQPFTSWQNTRL